MDRGTDPRRLIGGCAKVAKPASSSQVRLERCAYRRSPSQFAHRSCSFGRSESEP